MGYQKHNFKSGDVLTAKIMNEIEQGIVDASSSQTNLELTKTINNVKVVFAGLQQKNIFAVAEIENTVEKRQTADGATNGITVLDGSYATVNKIKGKTVASKNLVDIADQTLTGISNPTTLWNGELTGDFTASWKILSDSQPPYSEMPFIAFTFKDGREVNGFYETNQVSFSGTLTSVTLLNFCNVVGTLSNFTLNYGSTVEPYVPYFAGLKNAQISGIKSTGRNLFNPNRTVVAFGDISASTIRNFVPNSIIVGVGYANDYYSPIIPNFSYENGKLSFSSGDTNYGIGFNFDCKSREKYSFSYTVPSGKSVEMLAVFYQNGSWVKYVAPDLNKSFTVPDDCNQMVLLLRNPVASEVIEVTDLQLEYGETATDYVPYTESFMSLPETVELGEWDYIENGKVAKQTETTVFDGAESWTSYGNNSDNTGTVFYSRIGGIENAIISGGFNKGTFNYLPSELKANSYVFSLYELIICTSTPNQTLNDWINYLSSNPLTVAYKGTATKTDIYADFEYQVWDKGQEQMQLENTDAIPTITADYYILGGTTE